jgi:hypothetical protein
MLRLEASLLAARCRNNTTHTHAPAILKQDGLEDVVGHVAAQHALHHDAQVRPVE